MKLKIDQLSITFEQRKILDNIHLEVKEGEFVSLIGPSGCGKSTMLNILAGMFPCDEGSIYVDGQEVHGLSPHFAYMPQNDLLLPWKNILDNVTLYAKIRHKEKTMQQTALKELERFGLAGYEYAYPDQLSGGMRQRAAFLRTALCDADIQLLDEPFGALDVITRNDMQDWLLSMRSQLQKTTLLVTHDIDEALYLSDRIVILSSQPASIHRIIDVSGVQKTRDWLYDQGGLRKEIYQYLKGEAHEV